MIGAVSHIGRETAPAFAREAANVVPADLDEAELAKVAAEIRGTEGGRAVAKATDVSDSAGCEALVAFARETFGSRDVVVNNAGKGDLGRVDAGDLSEFIKIIEADRHGSPPAHRAGFAALASPDRKTLPRFGPPFSAYAQRPFGQRSRIEAAVRETGPFGRTSVDTSGKSPGRYADCPAPAS